MKIFRRCLHKSCLVFWALLNDIHIVKHNSQNWKFDIWVKQLWQRNTSKVYLFSTKFFAQNILNCIKNILKVILRDAPKKIVQYGRFCAKNGGSAYPIFDIGTLFRSSRWLLPENLYIIRRPNYSPYSYFLNYSKIFYSKKVFFVPSNEHFFIKIKIFKLA